MLRFRLRNFSLALRALYAAGDVLTPAEAAALNEFRVRKIRAKLEAALQKMERQEGLVDEEALRALVKQYDESYRFDDEGKAPMALSRPGDEPLRGTIEWDLWELARGELERQLSQVEGELPTAEQQKELLVKLMELPGLQETARRRYALRTRQQKDVLLDLLGGLTASPAE